jgi:hypothetical protein
MNVVAMFFVIPFVADLMFPKTRLPKGLRPFPPLRVRGRRFIVVRAMAGEMSFDPIPTHRVIVIARRQCPNTVKMIGQEHQGIDRKRMPVFDPFESRTEQFHVIRFAENSSPPVRDHRKKVSGARRFSAAVAHYLFPQAYSPTVGRTTVSSLPDMAPFDDKQ